MIHQDLVEIAKAVITIDRYDSEARSGDAEHLLSRTADRAREVLLMLGEEFDHD